MKSEELLGCVGWGEWGGRNDCFRQPGLFHFPGGGERKGECAFTVFLPTTARMHQKLIDFPYTPGTQW